VVVEPGAFKGPVHIPYTPVIRAGFSGAFGRFPAGMTHLDTPGFATGACGA
jgi:hypothetical protein